MMLSPVEIDGRHGLVAYFNEAMEIVAPDEATLAKVVFDDGSRTFYRLQRTRHLAYVPHPLTPEERARAALQAWDTRGRMDALKDHPPITRFHGTASSAVDAIRRHGLVAARGAGADKWAHDRGYFAGQENTRPASVYFTDTERVAIAFGLVAAQANPGSKPVVIELAIPPDDYDKNVIEDEESGFSEALAERRVGNVPKEWVKRAGEIKCPEPLQRGMFPTKAFATRCHIEWNLRQEMTAARSLYGVLLVEEPGDVPVQLAAEPHPLTPEERHDIAIRAWDTRGRSSHDAPILDGVNSQSNAARLIDEAHAFRQGLGLKLHPKDEALAESALRALPLVHGTTVAGALGALHDGLLSHADMEKNAARLKDDINDLHEEIEDLIGEKVNWKDGELPLDETEVGSRFGLYGDDATQLVAKIQELSDVEHVLSGSTYASDKKLGLDRFVFMTHGALHQDYGPLGVVIDNAIINNSWATPRDIVSGGHADEREYDPGHVRDYQKTIVKGDDYYKVAAARAGNVKAVVNRSRDQLMELKAPIVPKQAVLGFIVHDDLDLAQRLSDKLADHGVTGKVLYISEPSYGAHARWEYRQLKYIQKFGQWDEDTAKRFNRQSGGGQIYVLADC